MKVVYARGINKYHTDNEFRKAVKKVLYDITDLSWLREDDKVLIKPSVNSPHPYPATTHPLLIEVVAHELKKNGAEVIIGDQSGHEWVSKKGSTIKNFENIGMEQVAVRTGVRLLGFETLGWKGYFKYKENRMESWPNGFYATKTVKDVKHIISLPRVSTHAMTGVSLALKNWVGILRDDSRMEMHSSRDNIFSKISEIPIVIIKKLRFTMFASTQLQTTFGPLRIQKSYVKTPEAGLIFGSEDLLSSEVFATAWLQYNIERTPLIHRLLDRYNINRKYPVMRGWKRDIPVNPWEFPMVKHALAMKLGYKENIIISHKDMPVELVKDLNSRINNGTD